jgi:GH15 family glucan-1,4-alpha-glucosidase
MRCEPRFNYATGKHEVEVSDGGATFLPSGGQSPPMALYATVPLERQSHDVISAFTLTAGERATFILGSPRTAGQPLEKDLVKRRFLATAHFWKTWISKSNYKGRWREMVQRSALLLKLLISRKYGSLIAAPTISFPE